MKEIKGNFFYTVKEAASFFRIAERKIYDWIKDNKLVKLKLGTKFFCDHRLIEKLIREEIRIKQLNSKLYYTVKETAEKLGITQSGVSALRWKKKIIPYIVSPHKFLYSKEEIEKFLKTRNPKKERSKAQINKELRTVNRDVEMAGGYKGMTHKTEFRCLKKECECLWFANPGSVMTGRKSGCPRCAGVERLTNKIVDERLKRRNIKRIGEYIGDSVPMACKCEIDGFEWSPRPGYLWAGCGCHVCAQGRSERECCDIIKEHCQYNYFELHKKIYFNNRTYKPDFYLEYRNKKIIIEYNGPQHYEPIRWNYAISQKRAGKLFKQQQQRDEELRAYCKRNNIYLLEVPYYWKKKKAVHKIKSFFKGVTI